MKNVIITLLVFCTIASILGVHGCRKNKNPNPTDTIPKNPCSFKTATAEYEWNFKDTGNISSTILALSAFIPPNTVVDSIQGSTVASTVKADLKANSIDSCQVSHINAKTLRVKIDSPANYSFDVMDSIWLYIMKKDGTAKTVVGNKGSIAPGSKEIIMNIASGLNVSPYVLQDSFKFQLGARRSSIISSYINGNMYLSFDAKFVGTYYTK